MINGGKDGKVTRWGRGAKKGRTRPPEGAGFRIRGVGVKVRGEETKRRENGREKPRGR